MTTPATGMETVLPSISSIEEKQEGYVNSRACLPRSNVLGHVKET